MKKIIFFILGLLVVTGSFNMTFGYQDQTAESLLATRYGCDDLVVRIRAKDFNQSEPTELVLSSRQTSPLLEALELAGYDIHQAAFKGIHRSLTLEFNLMHRTEGGIIWPADGEDSNISIVFYYNSY